MAIIIPSSSIYEIDNQKVLDNQISGVDVEETAFNLSTNLEHKEIINLDYSNITTEFYKNTNYKDISFGSQLFLSPNITAYYVKFYYDFNMNEKIFLLNNLTVKTENLNSLGSDNDYHRAVFQIYNPDNSGDIAFGIVNNKIEFDNLAEEAWGKIGLQRLDTNLFRLYLKIVYLGIVTTAFGGANVGDIAARSKERSISLYANEQIQSKVSYGTKSNLSLQSNELIQTTTKNGTTKISEHLANNIIYSYKNGKETAVIRCSINDYYNEDNSIAKSITDTTKDMTFRMYDNVIPMIPSPNGDVPMSKHKDGTNKIFKVLGTKLINNGAVWQELTLQERLRDKYIKFEIDGTGTNTISARANSTSGTTTGISSNRTMQYSLNGKDWNSWNGSALTITTSQPIYLRSNITANGSNTLYTNFFFGNSTTKIKCSGDMRYMAMTNNYSKISNTVPFTHCYYYMFRNCTSLTTAPSLPATTLADYCYRDMFRNCTSLTTAPSLPATTLATECYREMFQSCTSLTTAPSLPATTLADFCYYYMFSGCTSLTTAPSLPATTLADYCYMSMFSGCTSLTTAPSLPATTLADYCYLSMFQSCTSLTTAPSLPATTLADGCYSNMFAYCSSLTTAPSLPATTLANYCYRDMFRNCTSLTTAPSLPATTLAHSCYSFMFQSCTSLTAAPSLPATTLANYCYLLMFYNCTSLTQVSININNNTTIPTYALTDMLANTGTVSQPPNAIYCDRTTIIADTNATSRWEQQPYAMQDRNKYIKFKIDGDGTNTISARANTTSGTTTGISSNRTMQYSLNGTVWNSWDGSALTITTSQPIYLRSNITADGGNGLYTNFFFGNSTTKIKCSGDMRYMAMTNNYAEISNTVPFTFCYRSMFYNCTSLTTAPSLPATTLANYCYMSMFLSCTTLTTAPSMPATT